MLKFVYSMHFLKLLVSLFLHNIKALRNLNPSVITVWMSANLSSESLIYSEKNERQKRYVKDRGTKKPKHDRLTDSKQIICKQIATHIYGVSINP